MHAAENPAALRDEINDSKITCVQFNKAGMLNTYPFMLLGSGESLSLQFDIIGENRARNLNYTIVHCDADWQPSNMMQIEYIKGIFQDYIAPAGFGMGNYKGYVHYRVNLPSENIAPKISGNYVVRIFQNDPSKPILQKRFLVYENKTTIMVNAHRPTYGKYRDTKQEIDFDVNYGNLPIINPYRDLKTVILQNFRWDNAIRNLSPVYIQGTQLKYDYQEENLFDGNNEFRALDIRDYRYKGSNVRSYILTDTGYNAILYNDEDRSIAAWSSFTDNNGLFLIQNRQDRSDNNLNADYMHVDFKLNPAYNEGDKDVYIYGALTNWKLDDNSRMDYDKRSNTYSKTLLLKQGYYDYAYAVKAEDGSADLTKYEGSHWETENNYMVLVYWRPNDLTGDILIGLNVTNSINK